ncbi:MAG: EthD family reductase [Candidatus Rokuibacteriota bacterium]|nr:MAG: EthD family reductase [Candidatus Rokubacteria bacterium]
MLGDTIGPLSGSSRCSISDPCGRSHPRRETMIKAISLLVRKPGMTHEQFVKHWLEIHGPLALKVSAIRRYVQSHIVDERRRPDIPPIGVEIDGIAELWYDDRDTMTRALASPEMKALHADGALFIGRIQSYLVEEKTITCDGGSA